LKPLRLILYREEQQPLENFFRAKGIKTKNEMADDVSRDQFRLIRDLG